MISIRNGLIGLGFCRTMYAENKQNSIEGIYDGIYNNISVSLEVFANGYIARVENNLEHQPFTDLGSDIKVSSPQDGTKLSDIDLSTISILSTTSSYRKETMLNTAAEIRSIRSEVLTMQDILHSLEKLTTNLQIKEQSTPR